jgi:hypothetical protein
MVVLNQGRIQDFKLGRTHLKQLRRAEGGAKILGVFHVKNHDFTPKNHIFSNYRGRALDAPSPLDPPLLTVTLHQVLLKSVCVVVVGGGVIKTTLNER